MSLAINKLIHVEFLVRRESNMAASRKPTPSRCDYAMGVATCRKTPAPRNKSDQPANTTRIEEIFLPLLALPSVSRGFLPTR
jgi:hypothetical protein